MNEVASIPETAALDPLQYHRDVCTHLKTHERGLWDWFASDTFSEKHVEHLRLELLKSTFRLTPESNAPLYQAAEEACRSLDIPHAVTLYQGQSASDELNAELWFVPNELIIVLRGDITSKLDANELLAVLSHESAHHKLYSIDNGKYHTAMRLLSWCIRQPDCSIPFYETCRRYQLFTEIYADLGALAVTGHWKSAISSLIKVNTGLKEVVVEDYLAQANEVLALSGDASKGVSHPETYMRTKFLHAAETDDAWYENNAQLITGKLDSVSLDLLDQTRLSEATKSLIDAVTQHPCMRTDALESLAQQYFPNYSWADTAPDLVELETLLTQSTDKTVEYLCFVLLDFATADQELKPVSMIITLQLAESLGVYTAYEKLLRKELKQKKDDVKTLLKDAEDKIKAANHAIT